jgi:hypothetical protein
MNSFEFQNDGPTYHPPSFNHLAPFSLSHVVWSWVPQPLAAGPHHWSAHAVDTMAASHVIRLPTANHSPPCLIIARDPPRPKNAALSSPPRTPSSVQDLPQTDSMMLPLRPLMMFCPPTPPETATAHEI